MKRVFLCSMSVLIVLCFAPIFSAIVIKNANTHKTYFVITKNNPFTISYIHSVNRSPVKDYFRKDGSEILLFKTEFVSFGAGIRARKGAPEKFSSDGTLTFQQLDDRFKEISMITGQTTNHTVTYKGKSYPLNEKMPKKTEIIIKVAWVSIFEILKNKQLPNQ